MLLCLLAIAIFSFLELPSASVIFTTRGSTKSVVVNVTVNAAAGNLIMGASGATSSSYSFSRNVTTSFYCDGSLWYVM